MSQPKFLALDRIIADVEEARRRRNRLHLVNPLPLGEPAPPRPKVESKYPWFILAALRERGAAAVTELHVAPEWRPGRPEPLSDEMMLYGFRHLLRAGLVERTTEVVEAQGAVWIRYRPALRIRHRSRRRA